MGVTDVSSERSFLTKRMQTNFARIWLFARMRTDVIVEVKLTAESSWAQLTFVRLFTCVVTNVTAQAGFM